jgi:hypothetical protein
MTRDEDRAAELLALDELPHLVMQRLGATSRHDKTQKARTKAVRRMKEPLGVALGCFDRDNFHRL